MPRLVLRWFLAAACCLSACVPIQISRPAFKVGLLAPFDGQGRAIGYEALYAAKLALQERNASGGLAGWSVELVALDNGNQPDESIKQARVLAVDPDVMRMVVVLHLIDVAPTRPLLASFAIPFELVAADGGESVPTSSPAFVEAYQGISGGITPGALAARTYASVRQMLGLMEGQIRSAGRPRRD
jgi:hypothetical protein